MLDTEERECPEEEPSVRAVRGGRQALTEAYGMRFIRDVINGRMDNLTFLKYLYFESEFVWTAARMVGAAVRLAPNNEALMLHSDSLHGLVNEQRDYFNGAFGACGIPAHPSSDALELGARLRDWACELIRVGDYADLVTFMYATEYFYFKWCSEACGVGISEPIREWIDLHTTPEFRSRVACLKREVDGIRMDDESQERINHVFRQTILLEIDFHEAAYF